jgi:predicted GIY-YIG superfamily endonuclease
MEEVLQLITVKTSLDDVASPVHNRVMTQATYPYRICDVALPQCNTGYVYMLISLKDFNFSYIGKTLSIRRRIQQHNSGIGSVSTEPLHLRPYALFAYICGFDSKNDLLFYIERMWKVKRDGLIRNGVNDLKAWASCGSEIIAELDEENFGVNPSDLTLVCLFND